MDVIFSKELRCIIRRRELAQAKKYGRLSTSNEKQGKIAQKLEIKVEFIE